MKHIASLHQFNCNAKQAGMLPTYWSVISLSTNDRTPEGTLGSEGAGYA